MRVYSQHIFATLQTASLPVVVITHSTTYTPTAYGMICMNRAFSQTVRSFCYHINSHIKVKLKFTNVDPEMLNVVVTFERQILNFRKFRKSFDINWKTLSSNCKHYCRNRSTCHRYRVKMNHRLRVIVWNIVIFKRRLACLMLHVECYLIFEIL